MFLWFQEWADALTAAASAAQGHRVLRVLELGAGPVGLWAIRAAVAFQRLSALPCHVVLVEPEPKHEALRPDPHLSHASEALKTARKCMCMLRKWPETAKMHVKVVQLKAATPQVRHHAARNLRCSLHLEPRAVQEASDLRQLLGHETWDLLDIDAQRAEPHGRNMDQAMCIHVHIL